MGATDDRGKVMLAMGLEPDIAQHHHLVIARDLVECAVEIVARFLVVAGEPLFVSARHPGRGSQQALPIGVVAGPANECAHRVFGVGARRPIGGRRAGLGPGVLILGANPDCNDFTHLIPLSRLVPCPGLVLLRRFQTVMKLYPEEGWSGRWRASP